MWFRAVCGLLVLAVMGVGSSVGSAQAQTPSVNAFLQKWDSDHDGTLSLDEIRKAATAQFEKLDRNQKGRLTRNQLSGILSYRQFRQADKDHDGSIDQSEFQALVENLFQAADKDHDGTLDKKELASPAGRGLLRLFGSRQGPLL